MVSISWLPVILLLIIDSKEGCAKAVAVADKHHPLTGRIIARLQSGAVGDAYVKRIVGPDLRTVYPHSHTHTHTHTHTFPHIHTYTHTHLHTHTYTHTHAHTHTHTHTLKVPEPASLCLGRPCVCVYVCVKELRVFCSYFVEQ